MKTWLAYLCICLTVWSCQHSKPSTTSAEDCTETPVALSHAKGFAIAQAEHYTHITVFNPWKAGAIYQNYYLVTDTATRTPADGERIAIPLTSLMTNSSTHLGFLDLLGEIDKVTGVSGGNYIYNATIRNKLTDGTIKDLGDSYNLNIEQLLNLHPDAVMTTAYNVDDENTKRMRQTGLHILYNIEWQEKSLLGRAEWIKFVAAFFQKDALADSLFRDVEQRYLALKAQTKHIDHRPTIMSGQDFRGTWSFPGGRGYAAQLFRDAGASYYYADNKSTSSIASTIEEALMYFHKADIWIGVQAPDLASFAQSNKKYALFKAFKNKQVYSLGARQIASGGNDYWEMGVARPDLILKDLIHICHPELMPADSLYFYQKLK